MPSRVIVALDFPEAQSALAFVQRLPAGGCRLKVGKELFVSAGPQLVAALVERGFDVFLDLKFHDIPNTVAQACRAAARLGVWMLNVHALGGRDMMLAAREAVQGVDRPRLIAVTVLTSLKATDLREVGIAHEPADEVGRLAMLAHECRLDGVVCSALEAADVRQRCGDEFLRVTPGIRLQGDPDDDQKRVMTPAMALANGASLLVVGRPVTRAADPAAVIERINLEIGELESRQ